LNRPRFFSPGFLPLLAAFLVVPAFCQPVNPPFVGMGDSLGEGDQSYNASTVSQPNGYLNLVATQMGVPFQQPLINSGAFGIVGSLTGRSRVNPDVYPADLAVSGATTAAANLQISKTPATREIDLVLAPYLGLSQLQVVQKIKPQTVFVWLGNDDLIGYILNFSHLNDPTVTSLSDFTTAYQKLITGLKSTGAKVVVANIPDLTEVGFLFDDAQLTAFTGTEWNMPAGYYTTFPTMALLKLGVFNASYLQNPAYVLPPSQIQFIKSQIQLYNQQISSIAGTAGYPVVDARSVLDSVYNTPVQIGNVTVSANYNGGVFSLDGVHPSDIGYAIFANFFIKAANKAYSMNIPEIPLSSEVSILEADPFVNFDCSVAVQGRPGTGLLETLGPIIGVSGNQNNKPGSHCGAAFRTSTTADPSEFMRAYYTYKGLDPNTPWHPADIENVFKEIFHVQ
jgi:hypothetical protein